MARFVARPARWLIFWTAVFLVAFGPLFWVIRRDSPRRISPLSATFQVKQGEYRSPAFVPTADDEYQIDLYPLPPREPLKLKWKIVSEANAVLASGTYLEDAGLGNDAILCHYRPSSRSAQRIVLQIEGSQQYETTLHVSQPEEILDASYAIPSFGLWAVLVCGIAVGVSLVRMRRPGKRNKLTVSP